MKMKIITIVLLALVLIFGIIGCQQYKPSSDIENDTPTQNVENISYMYQLEDGKLGIQSLFPYSGINPDCDNQEGEDIAAIQLYNTSDEYLKEADIELKLEDGTVVKFRVEELPSKKSVMAFSTENISITSDVKCKSAKSSATFTGAVSPETLGIDYEVDGIQISVKNKSKNDITQLEIAYRDNLDGEYFGGRAYTYTIDNFSKREKITIDATDSVLGMVDVVHMEIK